MGRFRAEQLGGGLRNRLNQRIQSEPCRRVGGEVFCFSGGVEVVRIGNAFSIALAILFSAGQVLSQPPDTLWTYTYASSVNDHAFAIALTSDSGFVVGGEGRGADSTNGALLVRLDRQGRELWVQRYAAFSSGINSVVATRDGGHAMTGGSSAGSGMMVVKTDGAGVVQWSRYISADWEPGWGIAETEDSGFVVLGVHPLFAFSAILVRLDASGDSLWRRTFDTTARYTAGAVVATAGGGFLVCSSQNRQAYVVKSDSNGVIQWSTTFGSPNLTEYLYATCLAGDGACFAAGAQTRGMWTFNPYAARITASGDTVWTHAFPSLGPGWFYSVSVLPDGNIVLSGSTGLDYLVVLVSPSGDLIWSALFDSGMNDDGRAMCLTPDNGIVMAGHRHPNLINADDIWVVRTASLLSAAPWPAVPSSSFALLASYPNPFNGTTFIRFVLNRPGPVAVCIYDVGGRLVEQVYSSATAIGYHEIPICSRDLSSGCYFYVVQHVGQALSGKMVVLK